MTTTASFSTSLGNTRSPQSLLNSFSNIRGSTILEHSLPDDPQPYDHSHPSTTLGSQETTIHHFTLRALLVGLAIGVLICFCNIYFGLQTGWGSSMSLQGSLMGFAIFKFLGPRLRLPFTPVENVLVQSVASALGSMSLGCGFAGIIPALEFLLKKSEGAPIELEVGRLMAWSLGVSLFGSVFAISLRKQMIVRERLKFPTGTATALLIRILHGKADEKPNGNSDAATRDEYEARGLLRHIDQVQSDHTVQDFDDVENDEGQLTTEESHEVQDNMQHNRREKYIRILVQASGVSAIYTILAYFVPQVRHIPIFGPSMASNWLWTLNPSPAYLGQGVIMGPTTTFHMLLGAIVGWGILSPMSKHKGWAPGSIDDWEQGSKGWIMWISLAILLADSLTNLCWLILKPLAKFVHRQSHYFREHAKNFGNWRSLILLQNIGHFWPTSLQPRSVSPKVPVTSPSSSGGPDRDAPPQQLVSNTMVSFLLPLALSICVLFVHLSFGAYIPVFLSLLATMLALLASLMGMRATGETDICPASGISKLTQLVFALITSKENPNSVVINLLAGTISDSGASQASDLMQDLKTGHLLHASPKAQFYGQLIGSILGVVISPIVYRLYVRVYELPSRLFEIPGAYVWIFSARLLTGKGLPPMAAQCALAAGLITILITTFRIYLGSHSSAKVRNLQAYVPGGIAFAVGIYITPSYSIPRAIGGGLKWLLLRNHVGEDVSIIVAASGLILGEGVFSMVDLGLASLQIPHF